jgi:hypothetical protein
MAVVITSNNFGTRGMHEQTEKLLTNYILVAVAQRASAPQPGVFHREKDFFAIPTIRSWPRPYSLIRF